MENKDHKKNWREVYATVEDMPKESVTLVTPVTPLFRKASRTVHAPTRYA